MKESPYVDTSALAKWYIPERRSDEVAQLLQDHQVLAISRLTVVEFRCLLSRKGRAGELDQATQQRVQARFEQQVQYGFMFVHPLEDRHAVAAIELLRRLPQHPLRTLDALHLAIAREIGARTLVTADRIMAAAARSLGFRVARFD